jgi:hypothetical protein
MCIDLNCTIKITKGTNYSIAINQPLANVFDHVLYPGSVCYACCIAGGKYTDPVSCFEHNVSFLHHCYRAAAVQLDCNFQTVLPGKGFFSGCAGQAAADCSEYSKYCASPAAPQHAAAYAAESSTSERTNSAFCAFNFHRPHLSNSTPFNPMGLACLIACINLAGLTRSAPIDDKGTDQSHFDNVNRLHHCSPMLLVSLIIIFLLKQCIKIEREEVVVNGFGSSNQYDRSIIAQQQLC